MADAGSVAFWTTWAFHQVQRLHSGRSLSLVSESRTLPTHAVEKIPRGTGQCTKPSPEPSVESGTEQDLNPCTKDEELVPWEPLGAEEQEQGSRPLRISSLGEAVAGAAAVPIVDDSRAPQELQGSTEHAIPNRGGLREFRLTPWLTF